jgi:thiol-disulfide isomerase/thioredoxin
MRRLVLAGFLAVSLVAPLSPSLAAPPDAAKVLGDASAEARRSGRNVLVLFHASWCGWCKQMEAFTHVAAVDAILTRHFEVVWLDVQERGTARSLENPGGNELMNQLGGRQAGLPFFATVDPASTLLANSIVPSTGRNAGFPQTGLEIQQFLNVLKAGAPGITPEELATIKAVLRPHAD